MREWSAEVAVGLQLARRLITGQFPELEPRSLRLLAEGWDNAVWVSKEAGVMATAASALPVLSPSRRTRRPVDEHYQTPSSRTSAPAAIEAPTRPENPSG